MARTFAEVRQVFAVWAEAHLWAGAPPPPQAGYDAARDAARQAASEALRDAQDWRAGRLDDEALRHRLTGRILRVAAAAWGQGQAAAGDPD